jgi:hypothetical protein
VLSSEFQFRPQIEPVDKRRKLRWVLNPDALNEKNFPSEGLVPFNNIHVAGRERASGQKCQWIFNHQKLLMLKAAGLYHRT